VIVRGYFIGTSYDEDFQLRQTVNPKYQTWANYLTQIGDKDRSIEAHKLALEKTPGLGLRIDIVLTLVSIGFFSLQP